jgi:ABC-2 type transport system ATP-binding protein
VTHRPLASKSITVKNLNRRFGEFYAVRNVNFEVGRGEFFGYLGANGAGKSTTIRILCGLLTPTDGEVSVAGFNVAQNPNAVKTRIGYMSQKFSLYPDLPVEENLRFFAGAYGLSGKTLQLKMDAILEETELTPYRKVLTAELSGGWQQRVALGNALLHGPEILFLDEPTAGVDPASRRSFLGIVKRRVEQGVTAFLTTHYLDEAEFCERVGLMAAGELVTLGTPQELKERHVPGDVFVFESTAAAAQKLFKELNSNLVSQQSFGNGWRIRAQKNSVSRETILKSLREIDNAARCAVSATSLDDVFFAVVGENKR